MPLLRSTSTVWARDEEMIEAGANVQGDGSIEA